MINCSPEWQPPDTRGEIKGCICEESYGLLRQQRSWSIRDHATGRSGSYGDINKWAFCASFYNSPLHWRVLQQTWTLKVRGRTRSSWSLYSNEIRRQVLRRPEICIWSISQVQKRLEKLVPLVRRLRKPRRSTNRYRPLEWLSTLWQMERCVEQMLIHMGNISQSWTGEAYTLSWL